ncbi:MAG TPA: hypothetical protein VGA58_13550, partial [bacterium]
PRPLPLRRQPSSTPCPTRSSEVRGVGDGEPLRSERFTLRWTAPVFFSGPRFDPPRAIWQDRRDGTALVRAVGRASP